MITADLRGVSEDLAWLFKLYVIVGRRQPVQKAVTVANIVHLLYSFRAALLSKTNSAAGYHYLDLQFPDLLI